MNTEGKSNMTQTNDGGPAFPISDDGSPRWLPQHEHPMTVEEGEAITWGGMSLRDWFAGMLANPNYEHDRNTDITPEEMAASNAYWFAEGMLWARQNSGINAAELKALRP